jgi:hypothetical protein
MIRPALMADMPAILAVYEAARATMRARGNPTQWGSTYPERALLEQDIQGGWLYVLQEAGGIHGAFVLIAGEDPTYRHIHNGTWRDDSPYAAIHRVAGDGAVRGVFAQCLAFCQARADHLRIDTHQDNLAMQHLVLKHGFTYCGIIYTDDGSPRLAYEWVQKP